MAIAVGLHAKVTGVEIWPSRAVGMQWKLYHVSWFKIAVEKLSGCWLSWGRIYINTEFVTTLDEDRTEHTILAYSLHVDKAFIEMSMIASVGISVFCVGTKMSILKVNSLDCHNFDPAQRMWDQPDRSQSCVWLYSLTPLSCTSLWSFSIKWHTR